MKMARLLAVAGLATGIMALGGCKNPFERQDQLISTHLAVLSVEDFASAQDKLSPGFVLTGEDAIKLVNPTIGVSVGRQFDSLRGSAAVTVDATPGGTGAGDDKAPGLPGPDAKAPPTLTPLDLEKALAQAKDLRTSRVLEYQLAQSLFEQVAMLNATVASAAVPAGYQGYIVQLQVGVMPRRRKLSRDVYADIAFFAVSKGMPEQGTRAAQQSALLTRNNVDRDARRIRVVPLLSTDSLESVVNSASIEKMRAFSAELRLAISRVNMGGSLERVLQEIEGSLGKELFSSYSVARLSENTLRARFGAMPIGTGDITAVPRTHKVPVLVLLPDALVYELNSDKTDVELLASAKTTLIDPESGQASEPVDFESIVREGMKQLAPYFAQPGGGTLLEVSDAQSVLQLAVLAQENDYQGFLDSSIAFAQHLKRRAKIDECTQHDSTQLVAELTPESVWLELTAMITKTQYTGARFTIQRPMPPELPPMHYPESVLAVDDGTCWTIKLAGIDANRLQAHQVKLIVPEYGGMAFAPGSITVQDGIAKLTFPSLKEPGSGLSLRLRLSQNEPPFADGKHEATIGVRHQMVSVKEAATK